MVGALLLKTLAIHAGRGGSFRRAGVYIMAFHGTVGTNRVKRLTLGLYVTIALALVTSWHSQVVGDAAGSVPDTKSVGLGKEAIAHHGIHHYDPV